MESSEKVCCLDLAAPETSQATIVSNLCAYVEEKMLELSIQRLRATSFFDFPRDAHDSTITRPTP